METRSSAASRPVVARRPMPRVGRGARPRLPIANDALVRVMFASPSARVLITGLPHHRVARHRSDETSDGVAGGNVLSTHLTGPRANARSRGAGADEHHRSSNALSGAALSLSNGVRGPSYIEYGECPGSRTALPRKQRMFAQRQIRRVLRPSPSCRYRGVARHSCKRAATPRAPMR